MAILFFDGFEYGEENTNYYFTDHSAGAGATIPDIIVGTGESPTGTACCKIHADEDDLCWAEYGPWSMYESGDFTKNGFSVSFRFKYKIKPTAGVESIILQFLPVGRGNLVLNSDGTIKATNAAGGILATSNVLTENTWYSIYLYTTKGTRGTFVFKIDGTTVGSGSASLANNDITKFRIGRTFVNPLHDCEVEFYYDDVVAQDADNYFDGAVFRLLPNGDASPNDWTPSSGSVEYVLINDSPVPNAASYISSATNANISRFDLENTSGLSDIKCISAFLFGNFTGFTGPTVRFSMLSNSVVGSSAEQVIAAGSRAMIYLWEKDFGNSDDDWTSGTVDALQLGIERTAGSFNTALVYAANVMVLGVKSEEEIALNLRSLMGIGT